MGDVRLTFLGPPEVRHADQVVQFSTRKELALLIYLAVEGRVQARQKLSDILLFLSLESALFSVASLIHDSSRAL